MVHLYFVILAKRESVPLIEYTSMKKEYQFYTYILASESGVLYIGMTNDLIRRI